eukprot:jgi/Psemu1/294756/fgenesh1_pm.30_\
MADRTFLTHSGIVPPFPADSTSSSSSSNANNSHPSRLLSLVRSIEKSEKGTESYEQSVEETVDLFNHLIAVYSRHGLLKGDSEKAEQILSTEHSGGGAGVDGSRKRKGRKGKSNNNNNSDDLRIQHPVGSIAAAVSEGGSSGAQQADEALIFTAILRILTPSSNDDGSATAMGGDRALLISLACELCLAISQHIGVGNNNNNNNNESDECSLAEYELLAQSGKPILSGLSKTMKLVEHDMRTRSNDKNKNNDDDNDNDQCSCLTLIEPDEQLHAPVLVSSIRLACSLVTLFGTKLSRSTALLKDLNATAWKLLTVDDDSVQESAARLVSCLPMAGGIDRTTPSDLWNARVSDTLSGLSTVLDTVAPLTKSRNNNNNNNNDSVEQWIRFVRNIDSSDESSRLKCFYRFTRGLTKVFRFLMLRDFGGPDRLFHSSSSSALVDAHVDVKQILGVVESFVSFPLSSETVYYRTKRRLRNETIDNGLLSPKTIATEAANHVKIMGHELLDCTLDAVGGPALLPFARRILRISYASILTSSSGPVRRVMDPTSAAQLEGKKRRWLHLSIVSRAIAIETFGRAMVAFGCDDTGASSLSHNNPKSSSSITNALTATTDAEKATTLVVGALVEQIGSSNNNNNRRVRTGDCCDDDWGSTAERVELVSTSAVCLTMVMVSCGGFLSTSIRSVIESVVVGALSKLGDTRQRHSAAAIQILSWSAAKTSILRLACGCVTTPWQDGASSSLVDLLIGTARTLKHDADTGVATTAEAALRICDALVVPRAPALTYVTRAVAAPAAVVAAAAPGSNNNNNNNNNTNPTIGPATTDAATLATSIESARIEAARARKRAEEAELAKKRKTEEKRKKDETEKHERAAKRQKALNEKKSAKSKGQRPAVDDTKSKPSETSAMDTDSKATSEAETGKESAKTAVRVEEKVIEKEVEETEEEPDNEDEEDAMDMEEKSNNASNDGSDDDELPEIFDGGPDSDDE